MGSFLSQSQRRISTFSSNHARNFHKRLKAILSAPQRPSHMVEPAARAAAPPPMRKMTPLELMRHRNDLMHGKDSIASGRTFTPRPTDVFIVTYPKCASRCNGIESTPPLFSI
jgi:hypothetical protein